MATNELVITRELYHLAIQELHPSRPVSLEEFSDQEIKTLIDEIQNNADAALDT